MLRRFRQLQTFHFELGMKQEQGVVVQFLENMIGWQGAAIGVDEAGQCFMALRFSGVCRDQWLVFDTKSAAGQAFENAMWMDFGLRHIGFQKLE